MGLDTDSDSEEPFRAPFEETRIRLSPLFNASLSLAHDALYSRPQNATDWVEANKPPTPSSRTSDVQARLGPKATAMARLWAAQACLYSGLSFFQGFRLAQARPRLEPRLMG